MGLVLVLKIIAAFGTAAIGALALINPAAIYGFTGLNVDGSRGVSEIRAIFGGLFIGLGIAPFILGASAYRFLGIGYLAIALARLFSIFFDQSFAQSNLISLGVEILLGVILIL